MKLPKKTSARNENISLSELADRTRSMGVPEDVEFNQDTVFSTDSGGELMLAGYKTGALAAYQVKSATGSSVDLRGLKDGGQFTQAIADELNMGIRDREWDDGHVMRVVDGHVGGVVSRLYSPVPHHQLVERMAGNPLLKDARVHRLELTHARMSFTITSDVDPWEVDGGIKAGLMGQNGQFGDRSLSLTAMLYRLLCSNGMVDVHDDEKIQERHVDLSILDVEVDRVVSRASDMFRASEVAMTTKVDVYTALADLYKFDLINRGQFVRAVTMVEERFNGVGVAGASTTLWGLAQVVSAAARFYAFTTATDMGRLSGRLLTQGFNATLEGLTIVNEDSEKILVEARQIEA